MIDLGPEQLAIVKRILSEHLRGAEVRAFGSRVTGTAKDYSDLDLAVVADARLSQRTLADLKYAFEESDLPFRVDVIDWQAIGEEFRAIIQKQYVVILGPAANRTNPEDS